MLLPHESSLREYILDPFFVANAIENTFGCLHTAGFNSDQMERLSAACGVSYGGPVGTKRLTFGHCRRRVLARPIVGDDGFGSCYRGVYRRLVALIP
jgi:hypothetical protein